MKSIGKLKLVQLNKCELSKRAENALKGGANCCSCGCRTEYNSSDNGLTNNSSLPSGIHSPGGGGQFGSSN